MNVQLCTNTTKGKRMIHQFYFVSTFVFFSAEENTIFSTICICQLLLCRRVQQRFISPSMRPNAIKETPLPHHCNMVLQQCHYCDGIFSPSHHFPTEWFSVRVIKPTFCSFVLIFCQHLPNNC